MSGHSGGATVFSAGTMARSYRLEPENQTSHGFLVVVLGYRRIPNTGARTHAHFTGTLTHEYQTDGDRHRRLEWIDWITKTLLKRRYRGGQQRGHASPRGQYSSPHPIVLVDGDVADPRPPPPPHGRRAIRPFQSAVNNAGSFIVKPFMESTIDEFQRPSRRISPASSRRSQPFAR